MTTGCTGTHLENIWNNTGQNRTSSSNMAQLSMVFSIHGTFYFARHLTYDTLSTPKTSSPIGLHHGGHLPLKNLNTHNETKPTVILPNYLRMAQIHTVHNTSV